MNKKGIIVVASILVLALSGFTKAPQKLMNMGAMKSTQAITKNMDKNENAKGLKVAVDKGVRTEKSSCCAVVEVVPPTCCEPVINEAGVAITPDCCIPSMNDVGELVAAACCTPVEGVEQVKADCCEPVINEAGESVLADCCIVE